jgi:hypothetical protein
VRLDAALEHQKRNDCTAEVAIGMDHEAALEKQGQQALDDDGNLVACHVPELIEGIVPLVQLGCVGLVEESYLVVKHVFKV